MSSTRTQLENWLKTIDVKADRVLDVGGGSNPVKGRTKSWDVKEYKILDNGLEEMKQKPDYDLDLNKKIYFTDPGDMPTEEECYDIVFCLEVFEYIWNPVQAMKNIANCLKKDGILYISFPFIYPHHSPEEYDYLRYTKWGIEKLLKETGFKIEEIIHRSAQNKGYLMEFYVGEGMHLAKNYKKHSDIGYLVKAIKI